MISRHVQINRSIAKKTGNSSKESLAIGFQPPPGYNIELGSLYIIFEQEGDIINVDKLIQSCARAFYSDGEEESFETRFRLGLKSVNELLQKNNTLCNLAIAAIQDNQILFSTVGSAYMTLIRNKNQSRLKSESDSNLFKDIGEGELKTGDKIIALSESLQDEESLEKFEKLVKSSSLDKLEDKITKSFNFSDDSIYSALVVTVDSHVAKKRTSIKTPKSEEEKKSNLQIIESDKTTDAEDKNSFTIENLASKSKKVKSEIYKKTRSSWIELWSRHINSNPKKALIISIASILLLIVIIVGFSLSGSFFSSTPGKIQKANKAIGESEVLLNQNQQDQAQNKLQEAIKTIDSIPASEKTNLENNNSRNKEKSTYLLTLQKIQQVKDRLNNIVRIINQSSFTINISNLPSLVWTSDKLYGLDSSQGSIIEINPLLGGQITRASNADLKNSSIARQSADGGILIIGNSNLWEYTDRSNLQQLKTTNLPKSVDIASYLNNIYLLSPSENQVVRYSKSSNTLSARTNMLRNLAPNQLQNSNSLVVEGSIFVSNSNQLQLFTQGVSADYSLSGLPEYFGSIKQIQYNEGQKYFLALNSDNNKLAILSANSDSANFIRAYALENDQKISSFTVSTDGTRLFVNSNDKIITYKIEK